MKRCRFLIAIALCACSGERFRIVEGPATLSIAGTLWTPGVTVQIEEGGRAWFGPERPPAPGNARNARPE